VGDERSALVRGGLVPRATAGYEAALLDLAKDTLALLYTELTDRRARGLANAVDQGLAARADSAIGIELIYRKHSDRITGPRERPAA
jgi:hypothetical protein